MMFGNSSRRKFLWQTGVGLFVAASAPILDRFGILSRLFEPVYAVGTLPPIVADAITGRVHILQVVKTGNQLEMVLADWLPERYGAYWLPSIQLTHSGRFSASTAEQSTMVMVAGQLSGSLLSGDIEVKGDDRPIFKVPFRLRLEASTVEQVRNFSETWGYT